MPSFKDLKLQPALLQRLQELDYHTPTPIQEAAIPVILSGQDVAGQAETGSGKTAAFGLPILQQIDTNLQQIQALVVVPTRELAVQVRHELKQYAQQLPNLKISAFYGGHSFSQERASLAFPPQVLVGTPGRLTDHLSRHTLSFDQVQHLVLDEADKLLEMGFQEELDVILDSLPQARQVVLFSATMPDKVKNLIADSLKDPKFIKASANALPVQVKQVGIKVEPQEKQNTLSRLLHSIQHQGTVVFANTRVVADALTTFLQAQQIAAKALHGGMEQQDRDKTMTLFRNGTTNVLVATDLAARGLDIANLATIIHFELPDDEAAYLHRSGRTGRAGKGGTVYTFVTQRDERQLQAWEQVQMDEWLTDAGLGKKAQHQQTTPAVSAFATLHINAGRKDKLSPRDIVGALIAETGLKADQIGKIEVQERQSFVAVPAAQSITIAQSLSNGKIKGRKYRASLVR
jgi:ATP-dependent RNA helicase DbpA